VRFQTTKTIHAEDPEIVLRALEACLRELPLDAIRHGDQIALHGLGPSPRVINRTDTTILHVETRDDQTVITADVSFQPSCLLSDSPQDLVVCTKLDQIFDQLKAEIASEQRRNTPRPQKVGKPSTPKFSAAITLAKSPPKKPLSSPPIELSTEFPSAVEPATSAPPDEDEAEEPVAAPTPHSESVEEPKPIQNAHTEHNPELVERESPIEDNRPIPVDQLRSPSVRTFSRLALVSIISLTLLVLSFYLFRSNRSAAAPPTNLSVPASSITSSSALAVAPPAIHSAANIHVWLEEWVASMRTRDPILQSSFYADTVDNYFGKRNVSHTEIMSDKKAAIQNREGLWTVKLEKISIDPRSSALATVHLVKHYIAQTEPARISEQFVPSRLFIKRINGQWKITSEQELSKQRLSK
jgi:hypothetical protein